MKMSGSSMSLKLIELTRFLCLMALSEALALHKKISHPIGTDTIATLGTVEAMMPTNSQAECTGHI